MALYMDIHKNVEGLTKRALEEAHQKDLEVQGNHGAKFIDYWHNETDGTACVRLPTKRPPQRCT